MPSAKQKANWARFAKMARARARANRAPRRRRAASHFTRSKRVHQPKRSHMARRRTHRKRSGSRRSKTINIAKTAVGLNAVVQMVEPFITAGALQALAAKDPGAFIAAIKAGSKEAISVANLLEAAGPAVVLAVGRKVASMVGAPRPRFGRVVAY